MINLRQFGRCALLVGMLCGLASVTSVQAAQIAPYEFDPTLSLRGDCSTATDDPVPDPSCSGEPPTYPAPPNGPTTRLDRPRAVALDAYGNEYIATAGGRLEVFDDEGFF